VKTYVINLPDSTERRAAMEKQLQTSRLDYEFIEAVDGRLLTSVERSSLVDKEAVTRYPWWLTPGAIGCILSHKLVYERVAASAEAALVLEDDAILPNGLDDTVAAMTAVLPDDGVFLLNFRSLKPCRLERASLAAIRTHEFFTPIDPRQPVSTLAYLVGPAAAQEMADLILPVRFAADSWGEYVAAGTIGSLVCVLPRPVMPIQTAVSTIRHDGRRGFRAAARETFPALQIRMLNRRRVAWIQNRVELVE
jgi:glycosyl transferase family 25